MERRVSQFIGEGDKYLDAGRLGEAERSYSVAVELSKNTDVEALIKRASALVQLDKYDLAEETATIAINLDPDNPLAYHTRARAYVLMENLEDAAVDFEKVVDLSPGNEQAIEDHKRCLQMMAPSVAEDYEEELPAFSVEDDLVYGEEESPYSDGNITYGGDENITYGGDEETFYGDRNSGQDIVYGDEEGQIESFQQGDDILYGEENDNVHYEEGAELVYGDHDDVPPARPPKQISDDIYGDEDLPPKPPRQGHPAQSFQQQQQPAIRKPSRQPATNSGKGDLRTKRYGELVHTGIERPVAEKIINDRIKGQPTAFSNGTFLLRTSEKVLGGLVVTMAYDGRMHHFQFGKDDSGYYVNSKGKRIGNEPNILSFIEYYKRKKDGMPTTLGIFVMPIVQGRR